MAIIDPAKPLSRYSFDDLRDLLRQGEAHWDPIHERYRKYHRFSTCTDAKDASGQWDSGALQSRGGRPAEVYNIVNGFVRPVVNLARQNPPAINVYPISDGASKTNARLLSGIVRAIEYGCGAQRAYCDALENAARGSIGILRVLVRDVDGDDDIDFVITHVSDPTTVLIDPGARLPDYSDAMWFAIRTKITDRQYKREFPDGRACADANEVEIVEMWVKDVQRIKGTRRSKVKIYQFILDAYEILDTVDDYPSKILPLAVVTGARSEIEGEIRLGCLTEELVGVQKEINFYKSEQISMIATAPKSTFYGDNDAFQSIEERNAWEASATDPRVFLGHKPGASVKQFQFPQIPTTYIESVRTNIDLARAITGIYPDPTLQNGLNAVSGKALKQQQAGQSVSTYAFIDSLNYAIKHIGEIILDLLPHYWNDDRVRLSMGVDGKYTSVSTGPTMVADAENFDLAYGRYAVSISTGPSYASQKDALIEMLLDAIKTNPQAMTLALPWIINQVNLPGSEELADLFSLTLPPEIQQFLAQMKQDSSDPEEKLKSALLTLQQLSQDAAQKGQMIQQLTAALENETQQLQSKEMELQSKAQLEAQKSQLTLALEQMRLESKEQIALIQGQLQLISKSMDVDARRQAQTQQHVHEVVENDKDRQHNTQVSEQQHAQRLDQTTHAEGTRVLADVTRSNLVPPKPTPGQKPKK